MPKDAHKSSWTLSTPLLSFIYLLCHLSFLILYHPWRKIKTKLLCVRNECCQLCWNTLASLSSKSATCLAHPQVYSLPSGHSFRWQPGKHSQQCVVACIGLGPRMYMYIQCILAMRHLVAMESIEPALQWLAVTNKVLWCCMMIPVLIQSDWLKFCEFVGASSIQLKALER